MTSVGQEPVGPIVVVGALSFGPRSYAEFAKILGDLSGCRVTVAPISPLDWLLGSVRGYGQLVFEVATAVDGALLASDAKKAVLVGHSAGGLACRAYIGGDPPYGGRRYSGHRRVSHLVTLGTPHAPSPDRAPNAISRINALFPGALHAGADLRYLSVASDAVDGASSARARRRYERLVTDGRVPGDGVVPVEAALLPGSEHQVPEGLQHNRRGGRWYGSDRAAVEAWWPDELRANASLVQAPPA